MNIEHTNQCSQNALACAVQNMRDSLRDDLASPHADQHPAEGMSPLEVLELVQEWARGYQAEGIVSCSCAVDTLRRYDADLRQLRKALHGDLAVKAQQRIDQVTPLRDELKAYLRGAR